MAASTRAEQKTNVDSLPVIDPIFCEAASLLPNQITDTQDSLENFITSSFVTIKTAGAGDCAFHASLGVWNEAKKQFECKDAASERAKVAKAIAESKPNDAIFPLISASLKELIVSGISVGENSAKARAAYQLYQQDQPQLIDICWEEFEKELKEHKYITNHMQQYASLKSKRLKEQFNDCESKDSDRFFVQLIASDPALDKAYRHYQNACSESFAWDDILRNSSILREYAEFIGTPGKWLLPSELHIIAIALNITIKFYNVNATVEIYNPRQDRVTAVYYNGANHYERIMATADLSSGMRCSVTNEGSFVRNIEASAADSVTISSTHATLFSRLLPSQELASSALTAFPDITTEGYLYAPITHTTIHHHHDAHHYYLFDLPRENNTKPLPSKSKRPLSSLLIAVTAENSLQSGLGKRARISKNHKDAKQEIKYSSSHLAIGASDFKIMKENGNELVDKTLWIKEVIDDRAMVKLIERPRRFGKMLNMSMLKYFFEAKEGEDRSGLCEGFNIFSDKYRATKYQISQEKDAYSLWGFLLLNGYLTHGADTSVVRDEAAAGQLIISNRGVEKHVKEWLADEKLSFNFKNPVMSYKTKIFDSKNIHEKLAFAEDLIVEERYIDIDIITVVIKSLNDKNPSNQEAAYQLIIRAEVIKFIRENESLALLLIATALDSEVDYLIAEVVLEIVFFPNEKCISLFESNLDHTHLITRIRAARVLLASEHIEEVRRIRGAKASGIVERINESILLPLLSEWHSDDYAKKQIAEKAVRHLTFENDGGFFLLKTALEHIDFRIQLAAAERLIELSDRDERLPAIFLAALKHSEPSIRTAGAKALGIVGQVNESNVLSLLSALGDFDYSVRFAARAAIHSLVKENKADLKAFLENTTPEIRATVIRKISALADRKAKSSHVSFLNDTTFANLISSRITIIGPPETNVASSSVLHENPLIPMK